MSDVLLLSGGIDSSTLLAQLTYAGHQVYALTVDYGQQHRREIECAEWQAGSRDVAWQLATVDLPILSALTGRYEMPVGKALTPDVTVVPARNTILVSLAAAHADYWGADSIYIGCNRDDAAGYPDCRTAWVTSMNETLVVGGSPVAVYSPFIHLTKQDVVAKARNYGVDLKRTWSCYGGGARPCGWCGACVARREAGGCSTSAIPTH